MRALLRLAAVVVAMAFSAAHAGNLERFYQSNRNLPYGALPPSSDVILQSTSGNLRKDVEEAEAAGRVPIGLSAFNGPSSNPSELRKFARKIGAQYVVYAAKYSNSVEGPSFGTSTFSRFGAFSFFMPSTIDRYEQVYMFFADAPRRGLGVSLRPLTDAEEASQGTGKAAVVVAVRRGSPAFMADVLPNDFLVSINGHTIYDTATFKEAFESAYGVTSDVDLIRNGLHIHKQITLSKDGTW